MRTSHTVTDHDQRRRAASDSRDAQCHAVIEPSDDQPDLCTIYSTAPDDSMTTTWITAEEGSYTNPEEHR